MALINLQNISLGFGSPLLLDGIDFQVEQGEKIALLGRNGSGKTSLMNIVNEELQPDSGRILREKDITTAMLPQDVPDNIAGTVYTVMEGGGESHHHLDTHEEQKMRQNIERVLSLMSLGREELFENLSTGMKRRVLLGRALAIDPDILLLDEPTNHLDIDSIRWLEDLLARYEKSLIFVTHDRMFLQKIATRIVEIDRGALFSWDCDYATFLKRKEAWLDSEETRNSLFDKKLAQEEVWIRKGIKARRTRNEGRVRALKKMREERAGRRDLQGSVRMEMQNIERSGKIVIEAEEMTFRYDSSAIISGFSTIVQRGDKVGIIGPNGCGKSTLIRLLLGELAPLSGSVKNGTNIKAAYFDQLRDQLDDERTVKENVTDGNEIIEFNGKNKHVIGYLQDFLFTPDRAASKVGVLSGGEKNRLLLAKLFAKPANLLVLDEPTNDLDIETVELLEELLYDYTGTLLLVSHDRAFLNNIVTSTIAFDEDGQVREYAGGYDDWLQQRRIVETEKPGKKVREKKPREKTKLSFKETQELESLPGIIEEKEKRLEEIHTLMSDPDFFRTSGEKVASYKQELHDVEKELEALYERWDYLEGLHKKYHGDVE